MDIIYLDKLTEKDTIIYFLTYLEYRLMKIIQYRNSNAIMPIQYGFSKTGFGSVLRYAITLIVTITESTQMIVFRSLLPLITHFSHELCLEEPKEHSCIS
ncbi:MAG: hypothetical protein DRN60_01310 [Thaumarchaeota archaeon]|nr:MAG: hypothetical protein DRN60_01310 [Nitrososphaerota archaeon]